MLRCRTVTVHIWLPEFFLFHGATAASGPELPHYRGFTITLRHTTLGRISLDEWPVRSRDLYVTTDKNHKRQTSMPQAGFEPAISASKRELTYALRYGYIGGRTDTTDWTDSRQGSKNQSVYFLLQRLKWNQSAGLWIVGSGLV